MEIFILFGFSSLAFSQTQLSLKSAFDSSGLSFATVFDLTNKIFSSANEKGIFKLPFQVNGVFRISYIGYEDITFTPNSNKRFDTLYLTRKVASLREVVIQTCKSTYQEKISNFKNNKQGLFGGVKCTKGENNGKVAVHINAIKTPAKLSSISFWLNRLTFIPKYAINSPLAISFYSYSEATKLPEELLYEKPIFYFPKKDGKQTLKIDSLNIHVPQEGIYVCFEFIMDERYQWEQKNNDTIIVSQGVHIAGSYCEGYELAFFDYKVNRWKSAKSQNTPRPDNSHGTIKIETEYQYCRN